MLHFVPLDAKKCRSAAILDSPQILSIALAWKFRGLSPRIDSQDRVKYDEHRSRFILTLTARLTGLYALFLWEDQHKELSRSPSVKFNHSNATMGKRKANGEDKAPSKTKMDVDGDDSGSEDVRALSLELYNRQVTKLFARTTQS